MFKKRLIMALGLAVAWGFAPAAHAGTMVLDSFVDQSPATIDLPATQLLMATVNTSATQGGNDATATAVSIGGTIVAADVAEVCVDYASLQVTCQANPSNLANISLSMGGNQKGGSPFDYRVTLNPSAAGKTIQLTVASITNADMVDNIPLPASTATRTVAGGAVAPTVTSPTFADVTDTAATLGGTLTDNGGDAGTTCGVEWGTTPGGPYPNTVSDVACSVGVPFTTGVSGLPASTQIYFRATATNSAATANSAENTFTTADPIVPPTVTVTPATNIGQNSATLGGNVTGAGNGTVTDRGVVWNTTSPAEAGGTSVSMGSGTGSFSQLVSGLPAGTQIFFKAYATNSAGTAYSTGEESFTTLVGLPTVDSPTVADINATTATLGGTMSSDGGQAPSDCGVEWGTTFGGPYPNSGSFGVCSEGVPFTVGVTGLPTGTVVYFRAYATNSAGTAYSAQANFRPAGAPVVTATPATNILLKSATLGGNVTSDGGSNVTARGIVWDTVSPPEAAGTVVPMGTGIGSFSKTVSGLPAGSTIFWKAYATNAVDTGYSGQQQFDTLSEPTVQASNLNFTAAGRSLRVSWTRGNGDGVIVVMRLAATGRTAPQDGDDYTGNPDFAAPPPELPVNSNNFVVYKGPGTSVTVTGLTFTTDYTVAVYEYAGTGVDTDYLLTPLVEATQQTTDYAVHNYDYGIDCNQCHYHSAFGARDTELKDLCLGCHSEFGDADTKQEFDNHTTPTKNPAVDFVDCGVCHEVHNLDARNTTESFNSITSQTQHNKSFLRANVDKYISTAQTPAFLHTDQPKREEGNLNNDPVQPALTPERAVEGGNATTARGYCQVCHTQTNYHRNNAAATDPSGGSRPGLMQCHDGDQNATCEPEVHCGDCHEHNNRFQGVNDNLPCEQCHDQTGQGTLPIITTQFDRTGSRHIPGGSTDAVQANCVVCHDNHGHDGFVYGLDADDGTTKYASTTAGHDTLATGNGEAFAPHCLSCHDTDGAASLPASGAQTPSSPFTGAGAPPVIDATRWGSSSHNIPTPSTPSMTCVGDGTNGCHGSGHGSEQLDLLAPADGAVVHATTFCTNCHDGTPAADVLSEFQPAVDDRTSGGYATINKKHDVLPADQAYSGTNLSCKGCHDPHADNAANPVANLDSGNPLGTYTKVNTYSGDQPSFAYGVAGDIDPVNPPPANNPGYTEPDYIEFCLTCHDGTAPNGITMPAMTNIAVSYATSQHGAGSDRATTKGWLKFPYTNAPPVPAPAEYLDGTTPYAAMNCSTCHGPHGSENIYNLRSSITVAGVQMTIGATNAFETFSGPTYELPLGRNGTQEELGWGAWCSFCHDVNHDTRDGTGCQSSHLHGPNGNF
jgi:hypothetical protein